MFVLARLLLMVSALEKRELFDVCIHAQLPEVTATLSSVKLPTAASYLLASSRHLCGIKRRMLLDSFFAFGIDILMRINSKAYRDDHG